MTRAGRPQPARAFNTQGLLAMLCFAVLAKLEPEVAELLAAVHAGRMPRVVALVKVERLLGPDRVKQTGAPVLRTLEALNEARAVLKTQRTFNSWSESEAATSCPSDAA